MFCLLPLLVLVLFIFGAFFIINIFVSIANPDFAYFCGPKGKKSKLKGVVYSISLAIITLLLPTILFLNFLKHNNNINDNARITAEQNLIDKQATYKASQAKTLPTPNKTFSSKPTATIKPTIKPSPKPTVKPFGIKIKNLLLKSEAEVSKILGEPTNTEEGKWRYSGTDTWIPDCPVNYYQNGLIEVKFIEGKAARITINDTQINYPDGVLSYLGLILAEPSAENENGIIWENIDGIYSIQAFPGENGNVSYVYVIADIKYK